MAGMVHSAIRPILALALMLTLLGAEGAQAAGPDRKVLVVVGAEPGKARVAERLVHRLGGDVQQRLPIVHGFAARVPAGSIGRLRRAAAIRTVARDAKLHLSSTDARRGRGAADRPAAGGDPLRRARRRSCPRGRSATPPRTPPPARRSSPIRSPPARTPSRPSRTRSSTPPRPVEPAADDGPSRARASMDLVRAATGAEGSGPDRRRRRRRADRLRRDRRLRARRPGQARPRPRLLRGRLRPRPARPGRVRPRLAHGRRDRRQRPETGYQRRGARRAPRERQGRGADGVTSLVRVLMALDWVRRNRSDERAEHPRAQPLVRRRRPPRLRPRAARLRGRAAVEPRHRRRRRRRQPGRRDRAARPPGRRPVPDRRRRDRHAPHRRSGRRQRSPTSPRATRSARRTSSPPAPAVVSLRVPGSTLDTEFPAARVGDGVLPRQRHLAGGRGGLRARRAAAQARPELTPDQVKALLKAGAVDLPADVSADGAGRVDLARTLALDTPSAAERGAAVRARRDGPARAVGRPARRVERHGAGVGTGENGWTGRRWSGPQLVRAQLVGPAAGPAATGGGECS